MSGLPRNPGRSGRETFPGWSISPDACEGRRKRKWQKGKRRGPGRGRPDALGEPGACMVSRMGAETGPPEVPRSPQRTSGTPVWPCSNPPHSPRARVAELFGLREGLSSPAGTWVRVLQVLGVSAALLLGCLSLTHLLGPAQPVEGPTGQRFPPSWAVWPLQDSCSLALVESIPQDLPATANSSARPLAQAWMQLLDMAQESVHVASFYWSLTGRDIGVNDSSSQPGETLLQKLQQLLGRNVSLAVATSTPSLAPNSSDLQSLVAQGAQVRHVPMKKLTGGVLHSKFWVVDGQHIYMGSANMDWRSLTQVKELGVIIYNCSRLAQDLEKTFQTYWALGVPRPVLPSRWPRNFSSHINRFQPLREHFSGLPTTAYFSASPPALCPSGRTRDLDALLTEIGRAREFVYVSVMEYFPTTRFQHPVRYWPVLDTALRTAAVSRRVHVRLLVSCWLNTDPRMFPFLRSLQALSHPAAGISLDVKVYIVPVGNHSNIPFSRVNHSKFMVTEQVAYIGTSNWSEDYFSSTSGVGLVLRQRATGSQPQALTVQEQLRRLFERDWSSPYALGLDELAHSQDCVWRH